MLFVLTRILLTEDVRTVWPIKHSKWRGEDKAFKFTTLWKKHTYILKTENGISAVVGSTFTSIRFFTISVSLELSFKKKSKATFRWTESLCQVIKIIHFLLV